MRPPVGSGRVRVRAIFASMRWSRSWFSVAALAAARPMPRLPNSSRSSGGSGRGGQQRTDHRGQHDQRHHARLGQLVVEPPAAGAGTGKDVGFARATIERGAGGFRGQDPLIQGRQSLADQAARAGPGAVGLVQRPSSRMRAGTAPDGHLRHASVLQRRGSCQGGGRSNT